jgi:hypothetical protein
MPSPFPGMDPWLEDPDVWRGVHARLITHSADLLQPQLRTLGFFVDIEERVFIEESERHVYPDLAIIERPNPPSTPHAAVLDVDEAVRVRAYTEPELRERFLQIFASKGRQLVTQIEYISHSNKSVSRGRDLYTQKREELRGAGVNLVEIDLLRAGPSIVNLGEAALEALKPWHYIVNVERDGQADHEVYPVQLRKRLPRIAIPLNQTSPDAALDIQAAFDHIYDAGPYPDRIDYTHPPIPPLSPEEDGWINELLIKKGLRK